MEHRKYAYVRTDDDDTSDSDYQPQNSYDEESMRYDNGLLTDVRGEDGAYKRLQQHDVEGADAYSDCSDYGALRRGGKRSSKKLFGLGILFGLFMVYFVAYKKVETRNGSVVGWSYNTSRDTKNYVLPGNVTLLNQPKYVCKTDKHSMENESDSEIFVLVIITSKMENFRARSAIRDTWANQTNYEIMLNRFQNVSDTYRDVNVTEKFINEYNIANNFTIVDKRVKRDLDNEDIELNNFSTIDLVPISNVDNIRPDKRKDRNNKHKQSRKKRKINLPSFIPEDELKNNIYLQNSLNTEDETADAGDDPRFDHDENKISTTRKEEINPVLGNFEEAEENKNEKFDYYEYPSEISNIMKIPPKGEKYIDNEILKSAENIIKLSTSDQKYSNPADDSANSKKQSNIEHSKVEDKSKATTRIKYLFLLGQSLNENNTELQAKIDEEANLYGDIIQESFIDSYNNLTLKSVMLLKWVVSNCRNKVRYIMKTDDDMYLNIPRLVEALQNKSKEHIIKHMPSLSNSNKSAEELYKSVSTSQKKAILKDEKLLMGDLICDARPILDMSSKWYSPTYMYGGKVYPRYLSGTGYVMSFSTAESLYKAALDTPLFHLEDIYITGMCSQKAGIKPVDHPGFSYAVRKPDPCTFAYLISAHQVNPRQLYRMQSLLMSSPIQLLEGCEIKRIFEKKNKTLIANMKDMIIKLNSPLLGSPKSFINGLIGLGIADTKLEKLGSISSKKRKKQNNGCF